MKLFLVWKLLSLPFIIRYCAAAASDPNPNRLLTDSETTSTSSISLPEEISKANPISAATITTTEAANFHRRRDNPPPDHPPFDIGEEESSELHSQSKEEDDPCLSDEKTQAPSRRRRLLRRQLCPSPPSSFTNPPNNARKNPVTVPSIPTWGNTDLNIPIIRVPSAPAVVRETPELCADDWQNVPVCAPEDSAIGDYLPSCRPRTFEKEYSFSFFFFLL